MKFIWNIAFIFTIGFTVVSLIYLVTILIGGYEFNRELYSGIYFLCSICSISLGAGFAGVDDVYLAKDLKDYLFKGKEE